MTAPRLCVECGAWIDEDALALNPSGLWCVKHELARRAEVAAGFAQKPDVVQQRPQSQTRFGREQGMPWSPGEPRDPHGYLRKPLPEPAEPEKPLVRAVGSLETWNVFAR